MEAGYDGEWGKLGHWVTLVMGLVFEYLMPKITIL